MPRRVLVLVQVFTRFRKPRYLVNNPYTIRCFRASVGGRLQSAVVRREACIRLKSTSSNCAFRIRPASTVCFNLSQVIPTNLRSSTITDKPKRTRWVMTVGALVLATSVALSLLKVIYRPTLSRASGCSRPHC